MTKVLLLLVFASAAGAVLLSTSSSGAVAAPGRCTKAQLRVTFSDVPGGLSHAGFAIEFTNRGQTCRIGGYPGVDGLSAQRRTVSASRELSGYLGGLRKGPIPTISLGTGQTASAVLEWVQGPDPQLSCSTVSNLRITPPGDMRSVQRSFGPTHHICSVEIHPVVAGRSGSDLRRAQGAGRSSVTDDQRDRIGAQVTLTANVTLRQALVIAGEHVIYAYAGETPPASLIGAIRAGEVAGVILFGPNVANRAALGRAITAMQAAAHASPQRLKLLILTDQEGGSVRRLPGPPTLSESQIGHSVNGSVLAKQAGREAAANLAGAGVNVNLAPVLDVYRSAGDFISQFGRSYSSDPAVVARLGAEFIAAQQRAGVAATAKHFPGLGSAAQDENTDAGPVRLPIGAAELRSVDEAPYRAAIAAGVKLIMVSWATYPALDRARPAGLSSTVIQGELRQRLRFSGVTITDGIEAGALTRFGGVASRSVLATAAGADLILACATNPSDNSPQIGRDAVHAIANALHDRRLGLSAVQQSTGRVLALRSQ